MEIKVAPDIPDFLLTMNLIDNYWDVMEMERANRLTRLPHYEYILSAIIQR